MSDLAGNIVTASATRNVPAQNHYGFIDNAKAIGIALIVLGHSRGLPDYLSHLIFSFHVPLFFFISGFLIKPTKLEATIVSNSKKSLQNIGIPYVLFFLVTFIYWLVTRNVGIKALLYAGNTWYGPVVGFFSGLESDLYVDPPLWFFPCFLLTVIAYHASRKLLTTMTSTCLFVVLAFAISMLWKFVPYRFPLGLDSMWIGLAFYAIGQCVRDKDYFTHIKRVYFIFTFIAAFGLLAFVVSKTGSVDLANMHFGVWPSLYFPIALLGIIATFSVSRLLPSSIVSKWLSENTLTIFPLHFIFFSFIRGMAISLHLIPKNYNYGIGWSVVSSALAILLCIPAVYILRRLPLPTDSFGRSRVGK
ncbi:acyltransferase family protein [Glaciimonas sp. Gout2]|uniref:acyltransferase family protein n=1 Tax=unclassified Glaciimonas TaxID=2644401 RepID=UPI002B228C34|nr:MULTISPECIES: acyltransferase family protein [unclassified Glaciimonas]MEB0013651.1 acyltransferase family protein [Glaciimonas sp. Cout2]MEB0083677.1 acyltransferase family protein [Glaciimonas sp. Gout2]